MERYIEAEALKKVMCEDCDNKHLCTESPACETVQQIDAQPTIDVDYERGFIEGYTKAESDIFHGGKYAPVKHGHWIKLYHGNYKCSECGEWWGSDYNDEVINDFNYCPHCGSRMDKE